jgi:hypothetical protein
MNSGPGKRGEAGRLPRIRAAIVMPTPSARMNSAPVVADSMAGSLRHVTMLCGLVNTRYVLLAESCHRKMPAITSSNVANDNGTLRISSVQFTSPCATAHKCDWQHIRGICATIAIRPLAPLCTLLQTDSGWRPRIRESTGTNGKRRDSAVPGFLYIFRPKGSIGTQQDSP